jgi:hypothetical protein
VFQTRLPDNFTLSHQKGVNSTYNLLNDAFLVKQLYMGTYVFEICKIREILSWNFNEIMILEMIYRNRTKRHVWTKSTKTIFLARALFTNLEAFSTLIGFRRSAMVNNLPKLPFGGVYILNITHKGRKFKKYRYWYHTC